MDENTPLLSSNAPSGLEPPSVSNASRRVSVFDVNQIHFNDVVNNEVHLSDHPTEVAFALVVLLHLRKIRMGSTPSDDVYKRWLGQKTNFRDADVLENLTTEIWTLFLAEYRSVRDIKTVLWTPFLLDNNSDLTCRVMDFLSDSDSPASLLSHPLVVAGIEHAWVYGVYYENSSSPGFLARYDALSIPRVMHFVHWMAHITFLALLAHYLLYPIEQPHTSTGWPWFHYGPREISLALLPVSFFIWSRSLATTSAFLVPLAFLTSLPSAPHPDSISFVVLQWAVFLQPLSLNLPQAPSHLFFIQPSRILPLAVLINRGLTHVLYPVILFFLPLLFLAIFLLSLSLADSFLRISPPSLAIIFSPPPLETRFTFLCFFAAVAILLLASVSVLAVCTPPKHHSVDPWERYTPNVGHSARRVMAGVVATYSTPYNFPPPFNLIRILVVWIPQTVARTFGYNSSNLKVLERVAWRIFVGPFVAFVGGLLWRPNWLPLRTN